MEGKTKFPLSYETCVYIGISNSLDFDIKYAPMDRREEYAYIVQRYCDEIGVSGKYLREKLEEYNKVAEERWGKKGEKNSDKG